MQKQEILACVESFFGNRQSDKYIQVVDDCTLYAITKVQLEQCYERFSEGRQIALDVLLGYVIKGEQRISLLSLPALDRYKEFDNLINTARLTVPDLASFLMLSESYIRNIRKRK